ncbi:antibiotic biosynthesis monooxygenase [Kitasatospora sp. MMS16-BH015]|uniref:antibiotic biosynthesis monooxygenase n=1 Tax=Kitasatospora sp. MMS16-BH015 TaxID=2018025 RepID=UPI000CA1670F|nr:antibiotic biosynthesis monooxygenase [Kitasatospora sp. MMS16-BH015]AUG81107.1 antibiotic biosynthesis monooxygenase [Kitasatospora sp. MMS16-BH015]
MTDTSQAGGAVTLLVAHQVDEGYEATFEEWARGILAAAAAQPGNLRTGLLRPAGPAEPWQLVMHFKDAESFQAWQDSPERAERLGSIDGHHAIDRHELRGLEGWFVSAPTAAERGGPPRWKMAVAAAMAISPLTVSANLFLTPHLHMPVVLRSIILGCVLSSLMVYLMLPLVNGLLKPWLFPKDAKTAKNAKAPRGGKRARKH